jgi:CBS domain-containing protein
MGRRGAVRTASGAATAFGVHLASVSSIIERADGERVVAQRLPTVVDSPLKVINRRLPLTAVPGTSLAECLRLIQRSGTGDSVLIVDTGGRLVGVLTERDIFGRLVGTGADLEQPVDGLMTTEPRTLRLDQTVRDAIELMETGKHRNVPIVDDRGLLAGVVRQQDILRFLAESFPEELLNLPPRPHQRMEESEGA